jgi:hypothetical protein
VADGHFRFVQFDFPGSLGLPEGRWVERPAGSSEASHVLIVSPLGATPAKRRKRVDCEPEATEASWTRVTVIDVTGNDGEDPEDRRKAAIEIVGKAMVAQRVASNDPLAEESPPKPIAARIGTGSGEQVADGRWEDAAEIPPGPRQKKRRRPAPTDGRFTSLLGGRSVVPACSLLALRGRADLDAGREREAVLQVEAAVAAAREELGGTVKAERMEALAAHGAALAAAAAEARAGRPGPDSLAAATAALERLEAALRSLGASG